MILSRMTDAEMEERKKEREERNQSTTFHWGRSVHIGVDIHDQLRFDNYEDFDQWLGENNFIEVVCEEYYSLGYEFDMEEGNEIGILLAIREGEFRWMGTTWLC